MTSERMDCRATLAVTRCLFKVRVRHRAGYGRLSMNTPVIANEVKQSMTSECMDCRATLAVTRCLFKVRVRYRAGYGRLAMTAKVFGFGSWP